jgi:hypothetical protein
MNIGNLTLSLWIRLIGILLLILIIRISISILIIHFQLVRFLDLEVLK